MRQREGTAASAVSLGLSLTLAVLLLVMTTAADPRPPPDPRPVETRAPAETPQEPDLGAVFLPPPPEVAPAPTASKPVAIRLEPPVPADPPTADTEVQEAVAPADLPTATEPPPQPQPEPQTAIRPPPQPLAAPVEITPEAVREGRALLRLLERGEGPDIEIAWPAAAAARSDLYRLFTNCFGMRTVVMTGDGEMFDAHAGRVAAGAFNADRYSGFVRQPAGGLSSLERAQIDAIRRRHGLDRGRVLRLFPRRVDAILLGALHRIAGEAFDKGVRIRARYRAVDNGVQVADIQIDGRAANELIVLPFTAQRACRTQLARR